MKKGLHFRTTIRRRCPNPGFLSNRVSTCLQSQETNYRLIQLFTFCCKECRPIRACGLSVSARTTVVNGTAFVIGRRKARCVFHTSPGHSNSWMMCANAQRPIGPRKVRRLTSFAKSSCPQYCRSLQTLTTTNCKPKTSTGRDFPSIPKLLPGPQSGL